MRYIQHSPSDQYVCECNECDMEVFVLPLNVRLRPNLIGTVMNVELMTNERRWHLGCQMLSFHGW